MSRSLYTGNLNLGPVTIPVAVYRLVDEFGLEGHLYHQDCGGKIREKRFCELHEDVADPVAFSGIQMGDQIVPITSEIRNTLLDRKVAFSVVSSHAMSEIPALMVSDDFMPIGVYEVAPAMTKAYASVQNNTLTTLFTVLQRKKRFLLCEVGLGSLRRLAVLLPSGRLYLLTYRQEIREGTSWSGTTNRNAMRQMADMVMALDDDFPEITLKKYSDRVGRWFGDRLAEVAKKPRRGAKKTATEKVTVNA